MRAFLLGAAVLALAAGCTDDGSKDPLNDPDPTDDGDDGGGGGGGGGSDDDTTPPDEAARDYDGVASVIGADVIGGELGGMLDMVVISEGGMPAGFNYLGVDATNTHHAMGVRGGLEFHYFYHCNDAGDVILPTCDGNANHSHVDVSWSGALQAGTMSISSVSLEGNWAVRDLSVDKPRVGGDGKLSLVANLGGTDPASFNITGDATFDRVRYAPGQALPSSGKIDLLISAERTRGTSTRTFAVAGALVFDGSTIAVLTLDASQLYSVDLTTGIATRR
jgi:hypothetical protein